MTKKEYLEALVRVEREIGRAFTSAVRDRVAKAKVSEVYDGVLSQDIDEILRAAGLTEADLTLVNEAIRSGYVYGAITEKAARVTFNIRDPRAERWLAAKSSQLVVEILDTQRDAIRIALRAGMEAQINPRQTALDIIGRLDASGVRKGGIVGLHSQFADAVTKARDELHNLDPNYLLRKRRNDLFDPIVKRAIDSGKPLSAKEINAIAGAYADELLQLRGETIARTESIAAIAAGREQAWAQAVISGEVDPKYITRVWSATGGPRTRDAHWSMNGQERPFGVPFDGPDGSQLMHPGDTSLGAPAAMTINCRCMEVVKIDFVAQQRDRERANVI